MDSGWTPERRARQAQTIQNWKPWKKSTGPLNDAGKETASRNASKGGLQVAITKDPTINKRAGRGLAKAVEATTLKVA